MGNFWAEAFLGCVYFIAFVFASQMIIFIIRILYTCFAKCYNTYRLYYGGDTHTINSTRVVPINNIENIKNNRKTTEYIIIENPDYPRFSIAIK